MPSVISLRVLKVFRYWKQWLISSLVVVGVFFFWLPSTASESAVARPQEVDLTLPGVTITDIVTVKIPGPTVKVPGPTVTVPGPVETVTNIVPGPTQTKTVTEPSQPQPTRTVTVTESALPEPTGTATVTSSPSVTDSTGQTDSPDGIVDPTPDVPAQDDETRTEEIVKTVAAGFLVTLILAVLGAIGFFLGYKLGFTDGANKELEVERRWIRNILNRK